MSAGVSTPDREPCHYGLPRAQCHIGCGIRCRPAHARRTWEDIVVKARVERIVVEDRSILDRLGDDFDAMRKRLAVRHEEEADLYARLADRTASPSVAAEHPHCGTSECCRSCG